MLKHSLGLIHYPTRHPTLREVSTWRGLGFSNFPSTCNFLIIGRGEFRFWLLCRKFYSANIRGPRLFSIFTNKNVLAQKPTFLCRAGCQFLPVGNFLIREAKPAGPVPEWIRPIVEHSLVSTLIDPPLHFLLTQFSPESQKMKVRGTVFHKW